jgi:uncharacterized SAM-binding protein YcdF (DUF218 family)
MKKRKILKYLLPGLALPLIGLGFNAFHIYQFASKSYDTPSDVAIVLGAGSNEGKVSPVFRERINHGITLFQTGKVSSIIFTGGLGKWQNISDSEAARRYAITKGIPSEHILIEEKSSITYENLLEAKALMEQKGFGSALIVSDPLHMKRAMAMCEALEINALPAPTPSSMYWSRKAKMKSLVYEAFYYSLGLVGGKYSQNGKYSS